jgi:hypothetical protein
MLSYPPLVTPRDILTNTKRASRTGANHTISEADLRGQVRVDLAKAALSCMKTPSFLELRHQQWNG